MCTPYELGDIDICTGSQGYDAAVDEWCRYDCIGTVKNYLYDNNGVLGLNKDRIPLISDKVTRLSNVAMTDSFQSNILDLCSDENLYGVCDNFLSSYCTKWRRADAVNNQSIADFCGCYVPYDQNYFSITKNAGCDPLCRRTSTVKNIARPICDPNVCVIDDVAVNVNTSNTTVSFSNICGNCKDNSCFCLISGANVSSTLSKVGISPVNVDNFCGGGSTCITTGIDGSVLKEQECSSVPFTPISQETSPNVYLVCILVAVLILAIIVTVTIR